MDKEENIRMITLHQAQQIRTFIRDLEDIDSQRNDIPSQFLADQDDEIRQEAWTSGLNMAEIMIKARLRKLGVDA